MSEITLLDLQLADLEYKLQTGVRMTEGDEVCSKYLIENRERLIPTIIKAAKRNGVEVDTLVASFIRGAHKRHEAGLLG